MPRIEPFEQHAQRYEDWFEAHPWVYQAELRAIKELLPAQGQGVEIGVGSGRFAAPLGIQTGVEPSPRMRKLAQERGIRALDGVAENLPLAEAEFDFALMVTVICFVDDLALAFREAARILKPGGRLVLGFVDRESPLGRTYQKHKDENVFYKDATFFSLPEVQEAMQGQGFGEFQYRQTVFQGLAETGPDEPVREGHGRGSFVALSGRKK